MFCAFPATKSGSPPLFLLVKTELDVNTFSKMNGHAQSHNLTPSSNEIDKTFFPVTSKLGVGTGSESSAPTEMFAMKRSGDSIPVYQHDPRQDLNIMIGGIHEGFREAVVAFTTKELWFKRMRKSKAC